MKLFFIIISIFCVSCSKELVVYNDSMLPTLQHGEKVDVYPLKGLIGVNRWQLIAYKSETMGVQLKRVIALPNEEINILDGELYIDGIKFIHPKGITNKDLGIYLPEQHLSSVTKYPIKLGENEYFVLGDNFIKSHDSRHQGPIAFDQILGVVEKRE